MNELQAGQGSGLGLYIAKGILEKHGGSLMAHSEGIGRGTVFTMTLPLYLLPDAPGSNHSEVSPTDRRHPSARVDPLDILVVDDAQVNRKLLIRLLENQGHVCSEAKDGVQAVELVKETFEDEGRRYKVILMDFEMPLMNGPEATREIRSLMGSDSFIVGLTGHLFEEDINDFKASGANVVLGKPLDIHVLMDAFLEHWTSTPKD